MLVSIRDRIFHEPAHVVIAWEIVVKTGTRRRECVAAAERRIHQSPGPDALLHRVPELVAAIGLNPLYSRFAAAPPLHHALNGFKTVKVVAVDATVTDAESFPNARAKRHLDGWKAPGHRQARSGHVREAHLTRGVVHLASPVPIPRQVLVVKHRD